MVWMTLGAWPEEYILDPQERDDFYDIASAAIEQEVTSGFELPDRQHLLDVGDSDTLLIPLRFASPYEHNEIWIASSPGVQNCLRAFAENLGFDLDGADESESLGDEWRPMATIRNVARVLYRFLSEQPNGCVAFS